MVDVMRTVVVDIASMVVSGNPNDVLVTYSLGSCVGVAIHDPVCGVGGMIHCMLPLARVDGQKAKARPCMFVDTGMALFLGDLFKRGVRKARAVVRVAGASKILDRNDLFRIGERNYVVLRRMLWLNDLLIAGEDVGGEKRRTVRLEVGSGRCFVKSGREVTEL